MNAAAIARALNAKKSGKGWIAQCVAHDDKNPSLSISEVDDKILVKCHAGCEQDAVIGKLKDRGLWNDVDRSEPFSTHPGLGIPAAIYDYHDDGGRHVGRIMRFDTQGGKEIRQCSLHGDVWVWKAMRPPRPLYRLPSIVKFTSTVLIVEGEKACAAAGHIIPDMMATTWAGGANASAGTDLSPLNGRHVTLWPDNDQPGRNAMNAIARRLHTIAASVRMFDPATLGELPAGWDAADALADKNCDLQRIWKGLTSAPELARNIENLGAVPTPRDDAKVDAGKPKDAPKPAYNIVIRNAVDVATTLPRSSWLLRPYIESDAIAVLYGDFGTYKSFVAIDWALRIALGLPALGHPWPAKRTDVVLVSAEGRGLPQRLRGWCIRHCPGEDWQKTLGRASLYCVEHPVNLSNPLCAAGLVAQIDDLRIDPGFVIIDTMSRNSDGRIENSTTDAATYLATIDQGIRARYRCGVLLTHHVGHVEKGRIRGPIVLAANTDALIRIQRPDPDQRVATITVDRLKDSDPPPPQGLKADIIELGELDDDGLQITTLALEAAEATKAKSKQPAGKQQSKLLAELERRHAIGDRLWTELDLRRIARELGMHRNSARDAVVGLVTGGYLQDTIGGRTLKHPPEACTK